jgi:hypothetical protein
VTWGVKSPNSSAFDIEDLSIHNGLLCLAGRVLIDGVVEVRVEAEKIRHAASVVTVPVCKKNMGKSNITFSENR